MLGVSGSAAGGEWGASVHTSLPADNISDVRARGSQEFGLEGRLLALSPGNVELSVSSSRKFDALAEYQIPWLVLDRDVLSSSESEHFLLVITAVHRQRFFSLETSSAAIFSGFLNNFLNGIHFFIDLLNHVNWNSLDLTAGRSDGKASSFRLIASLQRPSRLAILADAFRVSLNVQIFAESIKGESCIDAISDCSVPDFENDLLARHEVEASLMHREVVESQFTDCVARKSLGGEGNWHDCESVFDHVAKHFLIDCLICDLFLL